MKRILLILSILTAVGHYCMASLPEDSARVRFHVGKSDLDPAFAGNGAKLDSLRDKIHATESDTLVSLKGIKVIGGASPEGSVPLNYHLSERRAHAIFDYLDVYEHFPDSAVTFEFLGRDWSGLRHFVEADRSVPARSDVLDLLDKIISTSTPESPGDTEAIQELRSLHGGAPYAYLYSNIYPLLRESQVIIEYQRNMPPVSRLQLPPVPSFPWCQPFTVSTPKIKNISVATPRKSLYADIRSNLLLDALALPNIGAEIYLGKNISLIGNWMYGWWDINRRHYYWRAYGGDLGVRYWFGKMAHEKPLTGHHIGLYAGAVTYDFEFGGTGYMGGIPRGTLWDRCNFFGGVEYGYSLPIARRLNLDFSIGIGYLGGKYIDYEPKGRIYMWKSTRHIKWFGPTKAEISLVWLIGHGNRNAGKGGQR